MKIVQPVYGKDYAPGFTLFCRSDNFISNGIIWFEQLDEVVEYEQTLEKNVFPRGKGFSHVVSVVNEKIGMEADEKGIHVAQLDDYFNSGKHFIVCREPEDLTDITVAEKLAYQRTMLGNVYDFGSYVSFMLNAISGAWLAFFPFMKKLPPLGHIPGTRICSAFESDGFLHTQQYKDIKLFQEWNINRIHPHRLWKNFPYKPLRFDKERDGTRVIGCKK